MGCGEGTRLNLRKRFLAYDPKRCAAQLQKSGELEWVCSLLAKKAFRLVLIVPGGVSLSFAGFNEHAGEEIAWPQVRTSYILRAFYWRNSYLIVSYTCIRFYDDCICESLLQRTDDSKGQCSFASNH